MSNLLSRIQLHDKEGNINTVIQLFAQNYDSLLLLSPELLKRIKYYLENLREAITPASINAIKTLPLSLLQGAGVPVFIEQPSREVQETPGRFLFPVAASTIGMLREIRICEVLEKSHDPKKLWILDSVGFATFRVLGSNLKRHCFWRPDNFTYHILDVYGREDHNVRGGSISLPLALALYSLVTGVPVPGDVSATGTVGRDGTVGQVGCMDLKLEVLSVEQPGVRRILVPKGQSLPEDTRGLEIIKVESLHEAISLIFGDLANTCLVRGKLAIEKEVCLLKEQYCLNLFDTCIKNAEELIEHLKLHKDAYPRDRVMEALFDCYWIKGSCHCHKGEVKRTQSYLGKAIKLYKRNPGLICSNDYFAAMIQYGVLLKDIFRYEDAEKIHLELAREIDTCRALNHVKGMNLSSLSQLYLARRMFDRSEALQKKAMRLINEDELCRNYGYLAQIHMRKGNFRKAASALRHYKRLLNNADTRTSDKNTPYYHWIRSEYLYRRIVKTRKNTKVLLSELHEIALFYKKVDSYVHGLIHKFLGLALLELGCFNEGMEELSFASGYFDSQFAHVLRVLGASVRASRALYLIHSRRDEQLDADIKGIIDDLSLQKDIRRHFRAELQKLSKFARSPIRGNVKKDTLIALETITQKIPY